MNSFRNQLLFKKPTELKSRVSTLKQNELIYSSKGMDVAEYFKPSELQSPVTRVAILKQHELSFAPENIDCGEYFTQMKMRMLPDSVSALNGTGIW